MTSTPPTRGRLLPGPARLGLGLAAIARPAYITSGRDDALGADRPVEQLRARTEELLDQAYAAGVRYFDVARSYGRAEEFLAGWLTERSASEASGTSIDTAHPSCAAESTVGSKWGYRYVGDWRRDADVHEIKDHSLAAFERQSAESLDLLGPWLDVYHVHSATLDTGVLSDRAVHEALARLRDERGIRIGISTSGPAQADAIRRALTVEVGGAPLFTSFQSTWNVLEPSAGPALAEAAEAGALVIIKEAVANGRLAPGGDPGPLALAAARGIPLDQLALAAALAQPWAHLVLSGAITPTQLTSNLAARAVPDPDLPDLAEPPGDYWSARAARPWT